MAGRDEEFKRRLLGTPGVPILQSGKVIEERQRLDPRQMPVTVEEVSLRNCWHQYEPLLIPQEDGTLEMQVWYITLVDPARGKVYKYGLHPNDLEGEIAKLQALVELRDSKLLPGGEVVPLQKETGGDDAQTE